MVSWNRRILFGHAIMDTAEAWHTDLNVKTLLGRAKKFSSRQRENGKS